MRIGISNAVSPRGWSVVLLGNAQGLARHGAEALPRLLSNRSYRAPRSAGGAGVRRSVEDLFQRVVPPAPVPWVSRTPTAKAVPHAGARTDNAAEALRSGLARQHSAALRARGFFESAKQAASAPPAAPSYDDPPDADCGAYVP